MEEQFHTEAKKEWIFAADAARITVEKTKAVRIVSTRREESLSELTATWEQLLAKMKEQSRRSQAMKEEPPKHG